MAHQHREGFHGEDFFKTPRVLVLGRQIVDAARRELSTGVRQDDRCPAESQHLEMRAVRCGITGIEGEVVDSRVSRSVVLSIIGTGTDNLVYFCMWNSQVKESGSTFHLPVRHLCPVFLAISSTDRRWRVGRSNTGRLLEVEVDGTYGCITNANLCNTWVTLVSLSHFERGTGNAGQVLPARWTL